MKESLVHGRALTSGKLIGPAVGAMTAVLVLGVSGVSDAAPAPGQVRAGAAGGADVAVGATVTSALGLGTVTVTNTATDNGPAAATGVVLTTQIPTTADSVAGLPSGCSYSAAAHTVTCALGGVGTGQAVSRAFTVHFGTGAVGLHFPVTTTRTASSPADPNAANDTATVYCYAVTGLLIVC
ncbi:hypothetical protein [Streptantibioticus silvisoli]|uniref:DUF11 domain-containing protein n=1 Tax=Streptantibioticus silvisoli TaxID=2705255 RepID=A0ABT6W7W3_9ACTN|nr:hypothetical protein [Streptantibioticus silvisoli]MDI5966838.1 hypothetical protein [Streptantibioticus silvisoli]